MSNFIDTLRLVRDAESVGAAGKLVKFTAVTRSPMKNKDTAEYDSVFLEVLCFGKNIDRAIGLKKGDYVGVVGGIQINKYTNKEGIERQTVQIVADQLLTVGFNKKKDDNMGAAPQSFAPPTQGFMPPTDDTSLPFDI